ncbi:PSP1 domain-containing protein [Magnetococcales bacterium HHB-1]
MTSVHQVAGVRMRERCMVYRVALSLKDVAIGDEVLLDTHEGERYGRVVFISKIDKDQDPQLFPGPVLRIRCKMSRDDYQNFFWHQEKEKQAKKFCQESIKKLGLSMKLSKVSYAAHERRATFYFIAERRVDFRELVRVLARRLKIRVEMRQVGVRDETRLLGGMGPCGHGFCCAQFLRHFHSVSVRMAKNQELSLNPETISGVCGRLMCCLAYEDRTYQRIRQSLPGTGEIITLPDGRRAMVIHIHPLKQTLDLRLENGTYLTIDSAMLNQPAPEGAASVEDLATPADRCCHHGDCPKQALVASENPKDSRPFSDRSAEEK